MAHFTASINMFEHPEGRTSVSVKVFRVFEFGAAPKRPVWERQVLIERSTCWRPEALMQDLLAKLQEELLAE